MAHSLRASRAPFEGASLPARQSRFLGLRWVETAACAREDSHAGR